MPEVQKVEVKKKFNWWNLIWIGLAAAVLGDYLENGKLDFYGLTSPGGAFSDDWDGDNLSNSTEAMWGLNPHNVDSDGDKVPDAAEGKWEVVLTATGQHLMEWVPNNIMRSQFSDPAVNYGNPLIIDALEPNVFPTAEELKTANAILPTNVAKYFNGQYNAQ